jgi:hypothetical protein
VGGLCFGRASGPGGGLRMRRRGFVSWWWCSTVLLFSGIATFRRSTSTPLSCATATTARQALAHGVRLPSCCSSRTASKRRPIAAPRRDSPPTPAWRSSSVTIEDGGTRWLRIEDDRARINLNGLVPKGVQDDRCRRQARAWLALFFAKVVESAWARSKPTSRTWRRTCRPPDGTTPAARGGRGRLVPAAGSALPRPPTTPRSVDGGAQPRFRRRSSRPCAPVRRSSSGQRCLNEHGLMVLGSRRRRARAPGGRGRPADRQGA